MILAAVGEEPGGRTMSTMQAEGDSTVRIGGRRDVQGLRALAVASVIAAHLFSWPHGGTAGVDVFFVISGFLITSLLLREHESTGGISWWGFYRRRAQRIIPVAVLVVVATVIAARISFDPARFHSTLVDGVWALLLAANWRFSSHSTSHSVVSGSTSPLQHYWPLGVAEQLYLVWPWLILLVLVVLARRGKGRAAVGATVGLLSVGSFGYALWQTHADPAGAYFSSLSRAWELGVGATLAAAAPLCARIPNLARPLLAWVGLGGVLTSLLFVSSTHDFPAPGAGWPVLATALMIAAGTGTDQQRWLWPMSNRAVTYVGDLSYSLYMWHFPIIIIGTSTWGASTRVKLELLAAVIVISAFSYHLIEEPIRHARWEASVDGRPLRKRIRDGIAEGTLITRPQQYGWLALGLAAAATVIALTVQPSTASISSSSSSNADGLSTSNPHRPETWRAYSGPRVRALQREIKTALEADSYPNDLSPTVPQALAGPAVPTDIATCSSGEITHENCAYGSASASKTAVVVGDSAAVSYLEALRKAIPKWRLYDDSTFSCPFTSDPIVNGGTAATRKVCAARKSNAVRRIRQLHPDVVFISDAYTAAYRLPNGDVGTMLEPEWETSTLKIIHEFEHSVGTIVFLAAPPAGPAPSECFKASPSPSACTIKVRGDWPVRARTEQDMARQLHAQWIDSTALFCYQYACPPFVGSTPVKHDAGQMTPQYADKIGPALGEILRRLHVA